MNKSSTNETLENKAVTNSPVVPKPWQKKLPLHLTMSRVYLVPLIVSCMTSNEIKWRVLAALLFVLASITDYYDGYFARLYNAVSNMGKFMDPVADKILVTSVLVMLVQKGQVSATMVIIILIRDTLIGGIRSVAAADQIVIDAKTAGKWKTGIQMVAIPAVIIDALPGALDSLGQVGLLLLWISTILSITSGIGYFLAFRAGIKKSTSK